MLTIFTILGGSRDILPAAPVPVFVNPASPKITPPVLNFNLPRPGMEDRMDEDGDYDKVDDGSDDEDDSNLICPQEGKEED